MITINQQINPIYFWDVNIAQMDDIKSKRLIIERVCSLGNLKEIKLLLNVYGKTEVISELCNLNYIDNKTLQFFSIIFNIPKKKFKCYRNKQLSHQHWS
jgi:hypothetical protein